MNDATIAEIEATVKNGYLSQLKLCRKGASEIDSNVFIGSVVLVTD